MDKRTPSRFISSTEAAKYLSVTRQTISRWAQDGTMPVGICKRYGSTVRLDREKFYEWVELSEHNMEAQELTSEREAC